MGSREYWYLQQQSLKLLGLPTSSRLSLDFLLHVAKSASSLPNRPSVHNQGAHRHAVGPSLHGGGGRVRARHQRSLRNAGCPSTPAVLPALLRCPSALRRGLSLGTVKLYTKPPLPLKPQCQAASARGELIPSWLVPVAPGLQGGSPGVPGSVQARGGRDGGGADLGPPAALASGGPAALGDAIRTRAEAALGTPGQRTPLTSARGRRSGRRRGHG